MAGEVPGSNVDDTADKTLVSTLTKAGFRPGQVVQELGWDDDVDDGLRLALEEIIDGDLLEDAMEAVDVVLLWWRDDDGDIVDGVMDALTDLTDTGVVWVFTPKVSRPGHVDPADLAEAANTVGLTQTSTASNVSDDWSGVKFVRPKSGRR